MGTALVTSVASIWEVLLAHPLWFSKRSHNFKLTDQFQWHWNQMACFIYLLCWTESNMNVKAGDRKSIAQKIATWKEGKAVSLMEEKLHFISRHNLHREGTQTGHCNALKIPVKWHGTKTALHISETWQRKDKTHPVGRALPSMLISIFIWDWTKEELKRSKKKWTELNLLSYDNQIFKSNRIYSMRNLHSFQFQTDDESS